MIGASSFGKGTVQQVLRLPNNGELILTWAQMHAPSGYILNKFGVLPNICTGHLAGGYLNLTHLTEKDGAKIRHDFFRHDALSIPQRRFHEEIVPLASAGGKGRRLGDRRARTK